MDVCHVITKPELGGAQLSTLNILSGLPRNIYNISLITSPNGVLSSDFKGLKELKERFPNQQIVLVTAQGMDFQTTREAFRVGAYDYIWKPPQESVLRQLISALVAQEEQQRRLEVQDQLLRAQWERRVELDESNVRITYREGGAPEKKS